MSLSTGGAAALALLTPLGSDVEAVNAEMRSSNNSSWRRHYVRAVFAFVEASLHILKASCLAGWREGRISLDGPEIVMLLEHSYDLAPEGSIKARRARLPLKANLRFVYDVAAKAHGITKTFPASESEFEKFQHAIRIRDRLMHPKEASDLAVTDVEIGDVKIAFAWYRNTLAALFGDIARRLERLEAGHAT